MKTYLYEHCVPFQDTDMAGVVHYTRILGYAELAEHAFLRELGIVVISADGGLPKVHVECDYVRPMRFGDDVAVELFLLKCSERSVHWGFEMRVGGEICAKGKLVTAYVDAAGKPGEMPGEWQGLLAE